MERIQFVAAAMGLCALLAGCNRNPEAPPAATAPASAATPATQDAVAPATGASAVPIGPSVGGDPARTGFGSGTEVGGLQGQPATGAPAMQTTQPAIPTTPAGSAARR
jgi:hypothetical protein